MLSFSSCFFLSFLHRVFYMFDPAWIDIAEISYDPVCRAFVCDFFVITPGCRVDLPAPGPPWQVQILGSLSMHGSPEGKAAAEIGNGCNG